VLPVKTAHMRLTLQDLRFGCRTLFKTPGFTIVAVAVLTLGIGANSAMFSLVNAMLLRPLAGKADDMVGLYSHDRTRPGETYRGFAYANYADIRDANDVFDGLMAHTFSMVGVTSGDTTRQTFVEVVSSNYFDVLAVPLTAGRAFTREEERPSARTPVAIVRHDRADLLGKTVKVNAIDFTVVGVAPRDFTGTMALISPEMWLPLGMFDVVVKDIFKNSGHGLADRRTLSLVLAGRLKPGLSEAVVAARLDALSRQLEQAYPAENKNQLLTTAPLPRLSTSTSPSTDNGPMVAGAFLMGFSGIVLLIACLNIANMLLARGLLLASWATGALARSLAAVLPLGIVFEGRPDAIVLSATIVFAVIATVMAGLGPALKLSKTDLVADLKALASDGSPLLGKRFSARNVMVVGQIALSLMMLAAGGLFARGAVKASAANPGFSYERQLLVSTDPALVQYDEARGRTSYRDVLARVRALPGVAAVGMATTVPFGEFHEGDAVERLGGPARPDLSAHVNATYRAIGSDYFRALNLPMVRGREFTVEEELSPTAPRVAIVDERLARRLFGADDPIGQMIRYAARPGETTKHNGEGLQIVGIAAPIRDDLFDREAEPAIYEPWGRNYRSNMLLHVRAERTGAEADLLAAIRRVMREYDPNLPVLQATTMTAFHDRSLALWAVRSGGRLFVIFGVLALLLAVVGLYGVKSYIVSQRTREIGIRMALGARPADVLRMLLREGAGLAAAGIALGLPLAAALGFTLSSLLYDVKPLDPVVFTVAPLLLALAALVATWLPARRATRVTPLTALRAD
jgi:hypothetical protein